MSIVGVGDKDRVSLRVGDEIIQIWESYTFSKHYLQPTDGFRFIVGDEQLNPDLFKLLVPGQRVQLEINGNLQCTGYIDVVDPSGDRSSGNTILLEGRDCFSPVVDAEIDPRKHYPDKTILSKLLEDTLEQFDCTTFLID